MLSVSQTLSNLSILAASLRENNHPKLCLTVSSLHWMLHACKVRPTDHTQALALWFNTIHSRLIPFSRLEPTIKAASSLTPLQSIPAVWEWTLLDSFPWQTTFQALLMGTFAHNLHRSFSPWTWDKMTLLRKWLIIKSSHLQLSSQATLHSLQDSSPRFLETWWMLAMMSQVTRSYILISRHILAFSPTLFEW